MSDFCYFCYNILELKFFDALNFIAFNFTKLFALLTIAEGRSSIRRTRTTVDVSEVYMRNK